MGEEALAQEYYELTLARKRAERRLEEIGEELKKRTGERQAGPFLVTVSSFTTERVDGEACKALLGAKTPMKSSASVRLTVVVA